MGNVKLAQAEVKSLCHYARSKVLDLAQDCTASTWVRPGAAGMPDRELRPTGHTAADFFAKIEEDDLRGALEVLGVLSSSQLAFAKEADWPESIEAVEIHFSPVACEWLTERREELRSGLNSRRGTVEIDGGTRNETFCLFVLDTVAEQLAVAPDLKAA
jgi:hypothetical protein